jgi:hypothetical protein
VSLLLNVAKFLPIVSIVILLCGLIYRLFSSRKKKWPTTYLLLLLFFEVYPYILQYYNLPILSISAFIHFAFLTYFFYSDFFDSKHIYKYIILGLGISPLIILYPTMNSSRDYQAYSTFIYDFVIVICIFIFYLKKMKVPQNYDKRIDRFINCALLYFSFDLFLSISSNYLVNESLILVAGFWFLRAILLQLYYVAIIRYE